MVSGIGMNLVQIATSSVATDSDGNTPHPHTGTVIIEAAANIVTASSTAN